MERKDITVCIVNWNTKELLRECLKSVFELTGGVSFEVIVVDNASTDGSASMVRRSFPGCRLIECESNVGFVMANNLGLRGANGKYFLYLNPDTKLVTNALYDMYGFLEENTAFGAAGCRLVGPDGEIQYTCAAAFPTPFNELCHLFFLNRIFPGSRLLSSRELGYWDHKDSRPVECVSGACMMVKTSVLKLLNGFDEKIFMYAEDTDLCYRIRKAGFGIYYLASSAVIHYEGGSSRKKKNRNFAALMQRESNYYFFRKHCPGREKAYALAVFLGSAFRVLAATIALPLLIARKDEGSFHVFGKYLSQSLWALGLKKVHGD